MLSATPERLLIRGGHLVDPASDVDGARDVLIDDGKVVEHGQDVDATGARVIEVDGAYVIPGVVDSHVHLVDLAHPDAPRTNAYQRLARAGVTTAVEFFDFAAALDQFPASTAGLTMLGLQGIREHDGTASRGVLRDEVAAALRGGAVGVKLLGGHFPNTPETSARVIAEADALGAYCAVHSGSTRHGSNLDGMRETLELAAGRPVHVAHTNAYLRGACADVDAENRIALELLREADRVVSEAHLAEFNLCVGTVADGAPTDHIVRNCLRLGGFSVDVEGLEQAFRAGFAHVLHDAGEEPEHITGERGLELWKSDPPGTMLNFPVNNRMSAFFQTCARVGADGSLRWNGAGDFVVDAIASDGGTWRNVILRRGMALVHFGALTMRQLVDKACRVPAQLFGLTAKGHLQPGADADVAVVGLDGEVRLTIAGGRVVYDGHDVAGDGGKILTTELGAPAVAERGIDYEVVDIGAGLLRSQARDQAA